jgi:acetyl esterase/lipase
MSFADVIRSLEEGTFEPDRTDVDTASLVNRYPELGSVRRSDLKVPGTRGALAARLYLPPATPRAGLVWAHGGSFIGGDLDMPEANWVGLALAARGFSVLSVEYSKALFGVHFPVPSDDLLDAWTWAVAELDVGTGSLHLGGASAGGNLAAGVGIRLRDGQGVLPQSLVLVYPLLHDVLPEGSRDARAAAATLPPEARFTPDTMRAMTLNYVGDEENLADPYAIPARAELSGLPPTFILTSERDDLRASGESFAEQATDAGVTVRSIVEPGSQHGHLNQPHSASGQRSIGRIADWLDDFSPSP